MANPIKSNAVVTEINSFGTEIYSLKLKPLKRIPIFKPGQFLHLTINEYDPNGGFWPESRVFSIASITPEQEIVLAYSVKGTYTTRMRNEIVKNKEVWLKLPYGDFVINANTQGNQDVILIAGGTGVSPFIAYLESELKNPSDRKIHLIYGVRESSFVMFRDTIQASLKVLPNFSVTLFVENGTKEVMFENSNVLQGRIQSDHILSIGKASVNPVFFLSGPPAMIEHFKTALLQNNIDLQNIKIDAWE